MLAIVLVRLRAFAKRQAAQKMACPTGAPSNPERPSSGVSNVSRKIQFIDLESLRRRQVIRRRNRDRPLHVRHASAQKNPATFRPPGLD